MSKYSVSVHKLIDNGFDFGLNEYPIFDEEYRDTLNNAILDYYYMYEIGFETPALFRHYLKVTMNNIMPKYNVLFIAQNKVIENPLNNINYTETLTREVDNNGNSTSTTSTESKNLFQDTPQGNLDNTSIDNQTWATNLSQDKANSNDNTTTSGKTVETYTKSKIGSDGKNYSIDVYAKIIKNFESVNMMVINELQDLFMGVL